MLNDVSELFEQPRLLEEYPLRISFSGERAIDTGGVVRDMLSAFWEEGFQKHLTDRTNCSSAHGFICCFWFGTNSFTWLHCSQFSTC